MKKGILLLLMAMLFWCPAKALDAGAPEEGKAQLEAALPEQSQGMVRAALTAAEENTASGFWLLLQEISDEMGPSFQKTVTLLISVLAAVLLCAALKSGMGFHAGSAKTVETVSVLLCSALLFGSYSSMLTQCRQTVSSIASFSAVLQPVLASSLAMTGNVSTAGMLQLGTSVALDLLVRGMLNLALPVTGFCIAALAAGCAAQNSVLPGLANAGLRGIAGAMKLAVSAFFTVLLLTGALSGSSDRTAVKAARAALNGAIPVVGGTLSSAAEAMLSGAQVMKNTLGGIGLICVASICLLPLLRIGLQYWGLKAVSLFAEPIAGKNTGAFLKGIADGYGILFGAVAVASFVLFAELLYIVTAVNSV